MDYLQHGGDRLLPLFHLGRDRLRARFDPERFARRPADPEAAPGRPGGGARVRGQDRRDMEQAEGGEQQDIQRFQIQVVS